MSQNYNDDVYALAMVISTSMSRIEENFAALKSAFSGTAAPSNTVAGMWWLDTTNHLLKIRNEANTAWISVWDTTNTTFLQMFQDSLAGLDGDRGDIVVSDSGMTWTIGNNAVAVGNLTEYAAGNFPIVGWPAEEETSVSISGYIAAGRKIYLARGGTVRVKFTAKTSAEGYGSARVYINGVATGTVRTVTNSYADFTEDFTVSARDYVQIYGKAVSDTVTMYIKDFKVCTAALEQSCVVW